MIVILLLPLADLRVLDGSRRSCGPDWRLPPDPQRRGFLRGIGGLRTLRDEGAAPLLDWPTDGWYVDARGALRLPAPAGAGFARSAVALGVHPLVARHTLRRIVCDGRALWHVQFGVELQPERVPSLQALHTVIDEWLGTPVRLPGRDAVGRPLLAQRNALAALLERSTTPRGVQAAGGRLRTGTPLVYVQSTCRPGAGADAWMPGGRSLGPGITLFNGHWPLPTGDAAMVWLQAELGQAPRGRLNHLRLNLLRLHAEREVIKQVLRAAAALEQPTPALEAVLARAHHLLTQGTRFGNDQAVLQAAFAAYDDFTAAERAAVLALLAEHRQSRQRASELIHALQRQGPTTVNVFEAGARMNTITISGSGNSIGQINVDAVFVNATNVVNQAAAGPTKDALEQLLAQSRELAARLPEADREEVAKHTETIAREVSSTKPHAGILSISAQGLVDAAKAVAEMAQPIATAVAAVLGIVGLAL
jgi:hypothetical protein